MCRVAVGRQEALGYAKFSSPTKKGCKGIEYVRSGK